MYRDADDDTLMAATAKGEEAAFRLLVLRWEGPVKAFLVHMLGTMEEAEDLTQDTFVKVFKQAGRYRGEGKFKSWLFRIAGNYARSRLRRRKILGWVSFHPGLHDRDTERENPQQELAAAERADLLREAMARLPERQRQALALHRFQGLKYREAAEVMGTTVPGIESLIQRAMASLKSQLVGKVDLS